MGTRGEDTVRGLAWTTSQPSHQYCPLVKAAVTAVVIRCRRVLTSGNNLPSFSPLTNITNTILFAHRQNLPISHQFRITLSPELFIAATRPHDTKDIVCLVSLDTTHPITYNCCNQTSLTRQYFVLLPRCSELFLAVSPTDYTHKNSL